MHRRIVPLLAATAATAALAAAPATAAARVTISPLTGTPDASPQTQISVLGARPDDIDAVVVKGSRSGSHSGKLRRYSGGRGASFVPAKDFTAGEKVSVAVRVHGQKPLRSSFTIAALSGSQPLLNLPQRQPDRLQSFVSVPDLAPPKISASGHASDSIFLTPLPSPIVHPGSTNAISITPVGPGGPMILDSHGGLIWFKQLAPPNVAGNLRIQTYNGKRVLTWWEGGVTPAAAGIGRGVIADSHYREIAHVKAGNGYAMDIHEFELTSQGDALFTIYSPIMVHLPGTPAGKLSPLVDAIVQEVDIKTGLVVWEWHSYGQIPLADSYATPENSASFDAFHINSIQHLGGSRILISARDTSAIYEIDQATGRILWTLGGKAGDFHLGKGARFWFQHDARALSGNRISLFDDEAGPPQKAPASRALILKLDQRKKTATVAAEYKRAPDTSAQSEGSVQELADGNVFAGFGAQPFFSEFTAKGKRVFDASLPADDGSYRAMTYPWKATPRTRPAAVVHDGAVYVSWNGATDVASWDVLDGSKTIATAKRDGFETRIPLNGAPTTVTVRALDADGHSLAATTAR